MGPRVGVFEEEGTLRFTLPGSGTAHLIPDGAHRFAQGRIENREVRKIFWPDVRYQFAFDGAGKVVRCEVRDMDTGVVEIVGRRVGGPGANATGRTTEDHR